MKRSLDLPPKSVRRESEASYCGGEVHSLDLLCGSAELEPFPVGSNANCKELPERSFLPSFSCPTLSVLHTESGEAGEGYWVSWPPLHTCRPELGDPGVDRGEAVQEELPDLREAKMHGPSTLRRRMAGDKGDLGDVRIGGLTGV